MNTYLVIERAVRIKGLTSCKHDIDPWDNRCVICGEDQMKIESRNYIYYLDVVDEKSGVLISRSLKRGS